MSKPSQKSWIEARALLQDARRHYLIARGGGDPEQTPWEFPGGRLSDRESPEIALRRLLREQLSIELTLSVGQPPFVYNYGTHAVTFRYYQCSVSRGDVQPAGYAELRWVARGQLREYVFERACQQVADWLVENVQ